MCFSFYMFLLKISIKIFVTIFIIAVRYHLITDKNISNVTNLLNEIENIYLNTVVIWIYAT